MGWKQIGGKKDEVETKMRECEETTGEPNDVGKKRKGRKKT